MTICNWGLSGFELTPTESNSMDLGSPGRFEQIVDTVEPPSVQHLEYYLQVNYLIFDTVFINIGIFVLYFIHCNLEIQ